MCNRNYQNSAVQAVMKRVNNLGYFSPAEVKKEYSPKFVALLNRVCAELVANGKLVYDAQIRQYKKP